ncbi:Hpt domain-containing protein [Roseobacter sp. YSTF-M11]|uniref:Hpt domain-containing protein n=1 Tax=Roseobacter insulae TaxID=2859783 RepID=A0A9X1FTB6_9RHOB|nr:Hpt domain-containing protein [Roseobacter insulae]MBW4706735.1 Hpt domain-containing protein [Roseobacter insulae]
MIDWERVATLREEVGAEDFDEVVELFLEEVDAAISELTAQQPCNDLEARLHFLKGSALSLGFQQFSGLCQVGETAVAHDPKAAVDVAEILASYESSRGVFLSEMGTRLAG